MRGWVLCSMMCIVGCSGSDAGEGKDGKGGAAVSEVTLDDVSWEVDGFDATVVAGGYRDSYFYLAIRNDGNRTWDWPKFSVSFYDADGEPVGSDDGYFWSDEGGRFTPPGATAHEILLVQLDDGVRIDSMRVRGPELETTNEPVNWYVDEWSFGDEGSDFGWVDATVCASGFDDSLNDFEVSVIVTDQQGRPYDWDEDDAYAGRETRGCERLYVDDLTMPDDPRIIVMPTGW